MNKEDEVFVRNIRIAMEQVFGDGKGLTKEEVFGKKEEKDTWNLAGVMGKASTYGDCCDVASEYEIKQFIQKVKEDIKDADLNQKLLNTTTLYKIIDKRAGDL